MTADVNARPDTVYAARGYRISRVIHWVTVALASALLLIALLGDIDPHGSGNGAFLWHSSLGFAFYLLAVSRVLLWFIYRPTEDPFRATQMGQRINWALQTAFYTVLLALPLSGLFLALEEGMHSTLFGLPVLPQWYHEGVVEHSNEMSDTSAVLVLGRVHATLAVVLIMVIAAHLVTAIRGRARR
jgi:cytochrome b561